MKHVYFFLLLICFSTTLRAQDFNEPCATDILHHQLLNSNDAYQGVYLTNNRFIRDYINNQTFNERVLIVVPVVVHVVYLGESLGVGSNIGDAQIQSAITALNEDFRRISGTNGAGNGVDVEVEFCLAQRDPNGNSTTGINMVDGTGVCQNGSCYENVGIQLSSGSNEVAVKKCSCRLAE